MQISCSQCGGAIDLPEGAHFITCPYCSSALYLDKSKVVFHFVVSPTVNLDQARGNLKRWMAGNETVKDLDVHAQIQHEELIYFPMWRFVTGKENNTEEISEMAAPFSIPEIKNIPLSGGNLKFYSPQEFNGMPLKEPDFLLDSALNWIQRRGISPDSIRETNLIHIPFYLYKYSYKQKTFQAVVDASSGRVLAAIYPAKSESPFRWLAIIVALIFFLVGLAAPNFWIRLLLFLITAVPAAAASYVIVRKY